MAKDQTGHRGARNGGTMLMYRIRRMTVVLMLGIGIAGASTQMATTALAAPARPAGIGFFTTWPGARRAAGFRLVKPGKTYGLARSGKITVAQCLGSRKRSKRDVEASYGPAVRFLGISQNNAGRLCGKLSGFKFLGTFRVNGARAILTGLCGRHSLPSCRVRLVLLSLTWRRNGVVYQAISFGEWRATILGFARHLVPVR